MDSTPSRHLLSEGTRGLAILMYHSIDHTGPSALAPYRLSPEAFHAQMAHLRAQGYQSLSLQQVAEHIGTGLPWPERAVAITFDDGYRNFAQHAWPALEAHGFGATMFVVTDKVGGHADWDKTGEAPLALMDWPELRDLQSRGLEIGSHTATHPDLPTLTREAVIAEARRARATLQHELGIDCTTIAYPYGRVNDAVREALREGGCRIGVETWGGPCGLTRDLMALPRIEIFPDDTLASFTRKLLEPAAGFPEAATSQISAPATPAAEEPETPRATTPTTSQAGLTSMSAEPNKARQMAARLDRLVGDFIQLHAELNTSTAPPDSLSARIARLFCMKVTGQQRRSITPHTQIVEGIMVGFDRAAQVEIGVEPKRDHGISPAECLNTLEIVYERPGKFLTLELACNWEDIAAAQRFQLGMYAEVSRATSVKLLLRLYARDQPDIDLELGSVLLRPGVLAAHQSGEFTLPELVSADPRYKPRLMLYFDPKTPLHIQLNYLVLYFA